MAVIDNPHAAGEHARHAGGAGKPDNPKQWAKKHKGLAIAGIAGGGILLLSHKGSGGSNPNATDSQLATNAAAEQAAIDGAVQGQEGSDFPTDSSGGSSGSSGDDGTGTSGDPSGTTTGDGSGGGTAGQASDPSGGDLTINVNGPGAAPGTVTQPNSAAPKQAITAAKKTGEQAGQAIKAAENKNNSGVGENKAVNKAAAAVGAGLKTATKTPHTAAKKAPAPNKPAPKTKPRTKTKGSVLKYGRAFPGARSVDCRNPRVGADGVLHEIVVVNYGGYTEAHMCHNHGQAWTDNVPGYTPPSRGVPLERADTV